ncbi:unnamed protein product [Polarella glacialis]|uniref:Uncharacterized protein n=1 Tax=Polarella glacialis TaxID=89957 RepID=A0A813IZA0_POLGL|nr:unnamed protein product [Polarella glacialis]
MLDLGLSLNILSFYLGAAWWLGTVNGLPISSGSICQILRPRPRCKKKRENNNYNEDNNDDDNNNKHNNNNNNSNDVTARRTCARGSPLASDESSEDPAKKNKINKNKNHHNNNNNKNKNKNKNNNIIKNNTKQDNT